jgi:hypothetical protein
MLPITVVGQKINTLLGQKGAWSKDRGGGVGFFGKVISMLPLEWAGIDNPNSFNQLRSCR